MGKHDKTYTAVVPPNDWYEARIAELERRLAFAEENCAKLRAECAKWSKWMNESDASAQDVIAEQKERIKKLEETIVRLAVR